MSAEKKWYYGTTDRERQVIWEAASWVGTPFRHRARLKGAGVDCVHLAAGIYIATGLVDRFEPPEYSLDGGLHRSTSAVLEYVQATGKFAEVRAAIEEVRPGDLLCFNLGKVTHHVGVAVDGGRFVHAMPELHVVVANLKDSTWAKRLASVWRPLGGAS